MASGEDCRTESGSLPRIMFWKQFSIPPLRMQAFLPETRRIPVSVPIALTGFPKLFILFHGTSNRPPHVGQPDSRRGNPGGAFRRSAFTDWLVLSNRPRCFREPVFPQLRGSASNEALIDEIFSGTRYRVTYEPNMGDFLLCHAAFVLPAAFACYRTGGNLKRIWRDNDYLNRLIDANLEGYRAIRNAGHAILPESDADFEGPAYRKTCFRFFKLMCATSLGKICASDHAMNAIGEMSALNRDLKRFFDAHSAEYPAWRELEQSCEGYLK